MADLFAEQIINSIKTLLTGLATTGQNVGRKQIYDIDPVNLPFIEVLQGADTPLNDLGFSTFSTVENALSVTTRIYVSKSENTETELNKIRKEIYIGLNISADPKLNGLSFVLITIPLGADAPEYSFGERPIVAMNVNWSVHYRHSSGNPSV